MAERSTRAYRLDVVFPEGSDQPGWRPTNWHDKHTSWVTGEPCNPGLDGACSDEEDDPQIGADNTFLWPKNRHFLSPGGAKNRATLFRSFGAKVEITASLPITWASDPVRGGGVNWEKAAADLRAKPGEWLVVFSSTSRESARSTARRITRGKQHPLTTGFEAAARTVDGEHRVLARYIGGAK